MELSYEKKKGVKLDLIRQLMDTMKGNAGEKLKPKAAEVEIEVDKEPAAAMDDPTGHDGLADHLANLSTGDSEDASGDDHELDIHPEEEEEEEISPARRRLNKMMAR